MPPASPRRLLMTADAVGGVWTYSLDLTRALGASGVEVDLAVMGPAPGDAHRAEARRMPNLRLHESAFRLEWMRDPWDDVARAGEWLLDLEARLAPDAIHVNGYAHGALPFRAPVLVAAHSCVLSWWQAVHHQAAPAAWGRYAEAVARGVHAAGIVVAPSGAMADCVVEHYGRPRDLRVIANGRRAQGFAPAVKEPFVLTAGRLWDEAKNLEAVCAIAPRLTWPVIAAGDDRAPDGTAAAWGSVRHVGRLDGDELRRLFARAAIFALPARYEPFGLSPVEAALSGCALVLGDIRSLREVWGDAAVFVPPDNRCALAEALRSLIADASWREAMAGRARRRALTYTPGRMASEYLAAYRALQSVPAAV